jgi:hypothetical protein
MTNFCQEIGSQNQGRENSVAQSGNQQINISVGLGGEPLISSPLDESASSVPEESKKGGHEKSQAIAQAIDCGNGFTSVADFCEDIVSQNQGRENSVAQSGNQQINIEIGEPNGGLTSSLLGESASSVTPEETE